MESIILIVHIVLAIAIIAFVILQQGKGADAGASFGSGASQTVFGSSGSGNFLSRTTAILATGFFITSLTLAVFAKQKAGGDTEIGIPSAENAVVPEQLTTESDVPEVGDVPAAVNGANDGSDAPAVGGDQ